MELNELSHRNRAWYISVECNLTADYEQISTEDTTIFDGRTWFHMFANIAFKF